MATNVFIGRERSYRGNRYSQMTKEREGLGNPGRREARGGDSSHEARDRQPRLLSLRHSGQYIQVKKSLFEKQGGHGEDYASNWDLSYGVS